MIRSIETARRQVARATIAHHLHTYGDSDWNHLLDALPEVPRSSFYQYVRQARGAAHCPKLERYDDELEVEDFLEPTPGTAPPARTLVHWPADQLPKLEPIFDAPSAHYSSSGRGRSMQVAV